MDYRLNRLTVDDVNYIWTHLREHDRLELDLMDETQERIGRYATMENAFCAKLGTEPFLAFGAGETPKSVFVWFFATDEVRHHWRRIHKLAQAFLQMLRVKYAGKYILVDVWEKHNQSRHWLKRLGFEDTPHLRHRRGEKFHIMEWRLHPHAVRGV